MADDGRKVSMALLICSLYFIVTQPLQVRGCASLVPGFTAGFFGRQQRCAVHADAGEPKEGSLELYFALGFIDNAGRKYSLKSPTAQEFKIKESKMTPAWPQHAPKIAQDGPRRGRALLPT